MTVAGYCRGLFNSIEVRDHLKSRVSDGVSPEVLRLAKPETGDDCQRDSGRGERDREPQIWAAILILARGFAGNFNRGNASGNRGGNGRGISVVIGSTWSWRGDQVANPVDHLYRRDETVSQSWKGFDVARREGRIAKGSANFLHRRVQAVLKIDKCLRRPELFAKHFAADDVTGAVQQQIEDLEGLRAGLSTSGHACRVRGYEAAIRRGRIETPGPVCP